MQQSEVEKDKHEVSTPRTHPTALTLPTNTSSTATLRKRLTTHSPKISPAHGSVKYSLLRDVDVQNVQQSSDSDTKNKSASLSKKSKIYPFKNRSAEEFSSNRSYTFDKRSSSRESSDYEFDMMHQNRRQKNVAYKNEEKSQLICYKDDNKIIAIKNDSKLTKYNTFDMKYSKRGKMTKYKSLDESEPKTLVKYLDRHSNISISAQDFDSDFKLLKYDNKTPKRDIICDTVDAWAKKGNKGVFSNIKNTLFKSSSTQEKEVVYKPLVFGGTFPIDCPMSGNSPVGKSESFPVNKAKSEPLVNKDVSLSFASKPPKMREYGPAKSFDIDAPF